MTLDAGSLATHLARSLFGDRNTSGDTHSAIVKVPLAGQLGSVRPRA